MPKAPWYAQWDCFFQSYNVQKLIESSHQPFERSTITCSKTVPQVLQCTGIRKELIWEGQGQMANLAHPKAWLITNRFTSPAWHKTREKACVPGSGFTRAGTLSMSSSLTIGHSGTYKILEGAAMRVWRPEPPECWRLKESSLVICPQILERTGLERNLQCEAEGSSRLLSQILPRIFQYPALQKRLPREVQILAAAKFLRRLWSGTVQQFLQFIGFERNLPSKG